MQSVLIRKLNSFRSHPIQASQNQARTLLELYSRTMCKRANIVRDVEAFTRGRPTGFTPVWTDLWLLYRFIRKRRPEVVWEFGSGCSTVVLARALKENGHGSLHSIDDKQEWAESTAANLPAHLKDRAHVFFSPLRATTYEGISAFNHATIPDAVPNFVYLDGGPKYHIDLLEIEDRLPSDFCLVVDDRKETVRFLREHLKRRYRFYPRTFIAQPVFLLTREK